MTQHSLENVVTAMLHTKEGVTKLRQTMHDVCDMMVENADTNAIKVVMEYLGGDGLEVLSQ